MTEAITKMTNEIVSILDGSVHSVWLYGSIVLNDFHLGWSDIDYLVLTNETISEKQAQNLLMLRQVLSENDSGNLYYRLFEGIITSIGEYQKGEYRRLVYWGTSGQKITNSITEDIFASFELAGYGKCIYGNNDRSIFSVPGREKIVKAVKSHYDSIRKYGQQTGDSLYSCGWLLDIARCIYTLRFNEVIGKTQAGIWALKEHLFQDDIPLKKAVDIRQQPLKYKNDKDTKEWLRNLGPVVELTADVLEKELMLHN